MFYSNRVLFLHRPRTGGTALTRWAQDNLNASADFHFLFHAGHQQLTELLPGLAELIPFTIDRPFDERLRIIQEEAVKVGGDPDSIILTDPDVPENAIRFDYENPHRRVIEWLELMHDIRRT